MAGRDDVIQAVFPLMAIGRAPAALVLPEPDAILSLGVVVAREMDYGSIPVLLVPREAQSAFATGQAARIASDGRIQLG